MRRAEENYGVQRHSILFEKRGGRYVRGVAE